MTTKVDNNNHPGQASLEDEYWEALLQQGEFATDSGPPMDQGETWASIGTESSRFVHGHGEEEEKGDEHSIEHLGSEDPRERDWRTVRQSFERGQLLEAIVTGYNRGGLLVEWGALEGFVPASHLVGLSVGSDSEERARELAHRVGHKMQFKIIEIDPSRNRLVLSERATTWEGQRAETLLESLKEGEVRQGRVCNLCSFGAFVDLGGIDGLIHVSELSWQRVGHPGQVLQVGDEVEVYILGVDRERKRIALSLKRLHPDPWTLVDEKYKVGQLVEGTITNVVDFGAFVCVEEGVEGLIHISELAEGNFLHPRNVVQEGDVVTARIIEIDSARHRLGLSLRKAGVSWEDSSPAGEEGSEIGFAPA